ncbi:helix-turn-helix transcriptional regulator [Flexivirga meconopsidis]|uniref:helix-turn-helix transcriptional regulator n=1 Tax=Flexivirga meconopsidis TaxID=2977121 RepID=UPI00313440EC
MSSPLAPTGPIFGRAFEVEDFASLLADRERSSVTLLGGDAGVGKTRLVAEVAQRCRDLGGRVLLGHCLDLGDSAGPYLPITEMLRQLRAAEPQRYAEAAAGLAGLQPGGTTNPTEVFDAVATFLEQLAQDGPQLVVVEDVHWADRATRELLTYLFTRGLPDRVHLLATYRTDDLHRRHPLRPQLAEWSRLPAVRRAGLQPLPPSAAEELVRHLRPQLTEPQTAAIVDRAGGNPFFTEELVAASGESVGAAGLPAELADLLLVRVDSLGDDVRQVLRSASVAGRSVRHTTLAQLTELDAARLEGALRAALDGQVLVTTEDQCYAFRHALQSEALYDDLLPGERVRLHSRLADLWADRAEPGAAAAVALHAERAGRVEMAIEASVRAGEVAMGTAAPSNAVPHFERALSLASQHPELAGAVPVDLPQRTAEALLRSGDPHRAASLMRDALHGHSGPLPERADLVRLLASALLFTDLPQLPIAAFDEAVTWVDDPEHAAVHAALLALKGRTLMSEERYAEATAVIDDALTIARQGDSASVVIDLMTTRAKLDGLTGDYTGAVAGLEANWQKARAHHDVQGELRALHQLAGLQSRAGQHQAAYDTYALATRRADEGHASGDTHALSSRTFGAVLAAKRGDWAVANALLELDFPVSPMFEAGFDVVRMQLALMRGDPATARAVFPAVRAVWTQDMFLLVNAGPAMVEVFGAEGDPAAAVRMYDETLATARDVWKLHVFDAQLHLTAVLVQVLADVARENQRARSQWQPAADAGLAVLEGVVADRGTDQILGLESRAWLARARAELLRFQWAGVGAPDSALIDQFRSAAALFDECGFPYDRAESQVQLARALFAAGQRTQARDVASRAADTARALGARRLITAARVGTTGSAPAADGALTNREAEVLRLVAGGRTNGQIAAELFISPKTASVHVSNILAKLGATTRTEAADLARQQGLLD